MFLLRYKCRCLTLLLLSLIFAEIINIYGTNNRRQGILRMDDLGTPTREQRQQESLGRGRTLAPLRSDRIEDDKNRTVMNGRTDAQATTKLLKPVPWEDIIKLECETNMHVAAVVLSSPSNGPLRQAIRETWAQHGQNQTRKMCVVFVTGHASKMQQDENVVFESMNKRDVLRGNFLFNLQNDTVSRLLLGINRTIEACQTCRYIYVGYDETILNYKQLLKRLDYSERNNIMDNKSCIGTVMFTASPQFRNSSRKQNVGKLHVPPYCVEENGYVLTRSAAEDVLGSQKDQSVSAMVEVFLGSVAMEKNWTFVSDELFTARTNVLNDACKFKDFVTVRGPNNANTLLTTWKILNDKYKLLDCRESGS